MGETVAASDRPIVLIVGPTAGGKTALSVGLARRLPGGGECICADSMQVYRGLDIGTAKAGPGEQAGVRHHLYDVADPARSDFSVDRWLTLAEAAVAEVRSRGRWPVVVGGTNLYVQALLYGLLDGPAPDAGLRAALADLDPAALRRRLEAVDPEAAGRIHPNDRKRTIRAIEYHEATGRPLSGAQRQWTDRPPRPDVILVGLEHEVPAINGRINRRVAEMIDRGLVEEVRALHDRRELGPQAREALGYAQVIEHLEGRCSRDEAIEQIKIRTRRLAKQQRTWLRRFRTVPGSIWVQVGDETTESLVDKVLALILARAASPAGP